MAHRARLATRTLAGADIVDARLSIHTPRGHHMSVSAWDAIRWQRVTAAFQQALELPPEQRESLFSKLYMEAPDIVQAVQRMLAADSAFSTDTPPSATSVLADSFDTVLPTGTQLGAYAIECCLGVGGMGRVYRAQRVEGGVAQTVAIKCLRFPGRDLGFTRRFLRERSILASLNHPHIARFLDAGTDADGQPFVVLEYIDGTAITEFSRTQRLSLRARIELLIKVMSAVAYSHRQLIVHRDIKPGNVLVDARGTPHLLDFGIAKPLAALSGIVSAEGDTAVEQRVFSLAHAAPEQLRGAAIGTSSDIYALGVLAYELLCEQPPLALVGLSFAAAEREVLERFPAPLSERVAKQKAAPDGSDAGVWSRALRGDLDNIVLHALKKEPNARYATVDAFSDDLRRYLDSEPISLRGGQRVYRMQRFVRRHRTAVALAASLVLALAVGSVALWRQNLATEAERDTALAERRRAEALNGLLLNAFEAADPSRNRGNEVTAREVLDQAARRVDDPAIDPATRVALLISVSDVYRTLGLAKDSASAARAAVKQEGDVPQISRARAWRSMAKARLDLGEIDAAESDLHSATALIVNDDALAERTEALERELVLLDILIARGLSPQALGGYAVLYARAKQELGASNDLTLRSGALYARQLRILRRPAESSVLIEELLGMIPNPRVDPLGVRLLGERASCHRNLHQLDSAEKYAIEYVAATHQLHGELHHSYVSALDLQAKIAGDLGKHDHAIALYREILRIEAVISHADATTSQAASLNNLAHALSLAGRSQEAVEVAVKSVDMAVATLPAGHNNIAIFRITLADALVDHKNFVEALKHLAESERIFAANAVPGNPGVARAYGEILRAESLLALGRRQEAESAFARGWLRLRDFDSADPIHHRALRLKERLARVDDHHGPNNFSAVTNTKKE